VKRSEDKGRKEERQGSANLFVLPVRGTGKNKIDKKNGRNI
jgi:hypothetical protein